jgi:hypothetical protein
MMEQDTAHASKATPSEPFTRQHISIRGVVPKDQLIDPPSEGERYEIKSRNQSLSSCQVRRSLHVGSVELFSLVWIVPRVN